MLEERESLFYHDSGYNLACVEELAKDKYLAAIWGIDKRFKCVDPKEKYD